MSLCGSQRVGRSVLFDLFPSRLSLLLLPPNPHSLHSICGLQQAEQDIHKQAESLKSSLVNQKDRLSSMFSQYKFTSQSVEKRATTIVNLMIDYVENMKRQIDHRLIVSIAELFRYLDAQTCHMIPL